jgi:hypothetical protein
MIACKKSPCKNCPYRKDAPLGLWDIKEYIKLLDHHESEYGSIYDCHKKDGKLCTGWILDQKKLRFPSIMLRLKFIRDNTTADEIDSLRTRTPMFKDVYEMAFKNFPVLKALYKRKKPR